MRLSFKLMPTKPAGTHPGPIFYGWYVLIAASLCLFFVQGARSVLGVVFKPILSEMLWTRSDISLAALLNMTVFALSLTLVGRLFDRYGARWMVIISTLLLAAGFAGLSLVQQRWQLVMFYGVLAALGFAGHLDPFVCRPGQQMVSSPQRGPPSAWPWPAVAWGNICWCPCLPG